MKRTTAERIKPLRAVKPIEGARTGRIVSIDEGSRVMVDFPGNSVGPLEARLTREEGLVREEIGHALERM